MYTITTSIEIAASPSLVRAKFLDFSQLQTYHQNGFFITLSQKTTPNTPAKTGIELQPGDIMRNLLRDMSIEPIVITNSPEQFSWRGSFLGIFIGEHKFRFTPSSDPSNPKGTTFIHEENFSGILGGVMSENALAKAVGMRAKTTKGFEGFNRDLKAYLESGKN